MQESNTLFNQIEETKYLSEENTKRYRTIMRFFYRKYEEAEYWLYKEQIYEKIKNIIEDYTIEECERDIEFLLNNKSLTKLQDTKNINTLNDFKYHNFRYQMTDNAVVIERMTIELEEIEVKVASLEPRLFERINHLLKQMINIFDLDENKIFELWTDINNDFKSLNEQYQDFLKKFHEAKTEELLQSEVFLEFKSSMIHYIQNFITSYINSATLIKDNLLKINQEKVDYLMASLINHQKKTPKISLDFDYDKLKKVNYGKWQSLNKWFIDIDGISEGKRLLEASQNVIEKLYKYANTLMELHGNMINRKEEYKHICKLFDKSSSIEEAHKLSKSVFGICVANHFKAISLLNTESLVKSYDVESIEIPINTRVKEYKIKTNSMIVENKKEKKEKILKQAIEKEKIKKEKIRNLIKDGKIILKGTVNLDIIERRYILKLIENYHNVKTKESEFGYFYDIEITDNENMCNIKSPDGIFELPERIITIESEKIYE
jgi:uncharacterized protein (TIGR02677 family)